MSKKTVMPVVVLGIICIVIAALMGVVNMFTAPLIEAENNRKTNAALLVVLPDAQRFDEIEDLTGYPDGVDKAYKADCGYVFRVNVQGKEAMTVLCGVDNDGNFTKLEVISEKETPDYKKMVFPLVTGDNGKYNGMNAETLTPELVAGATLTSGGIFDAVEAALEAYAIAGGDSAPEEDPDPKEPFIKSDEELVPLAMSLVSEAVGFDAVELDGDYQNLVKLYREKSGKGYVAYLLVVNERYARVETETLVHVGINGKINGINRLVWKTSDAGWGYEPPTDDVVNPFYESLKGADLAKLEGMLALEENDGTLVTGATTTSKALVSALIEGVGEVVERLKTDLPSTEEELLTIAGNMVGEGAAFTDVTPADNKYVKKIYRENSGKGYIVYTVVVNDRYARVETETLIYVGTDGKIKDVSKLTWKTSDAGWGYEPPTDDVVNPFYESLKGADLAKLEGMLALEENDGTLVTGATTTSKSLLTALIEGVTVAKALISKDLPTPEDELLVLAGNMVGNGATFTEVSPSSSNYVKKLYREDNGRGYIVYMVVINERYARVETETLIYVGMDGRIKDISKLTWKTSDAGWGYEPPTDDVVNPFYESLKGADLAKLEGMLALEENDGTLVTGATTTSKSLLTALVEGVGEAKKLISMDMPTPEDELLVLVGNLIGNNPDLENVTPRDAEFVRRIYRDRNGSGYVVYTVVINERYGRVESETLIYVGNSGRIEKIARLTWKTSDAGWGYEPPADDLVAAFYDSLEGKSLEELKGLIALEENDGTLVTGATTTSKSLVTAIAEGLEYTDALIEQYKEPDYTARIVGIAAIAVALIASVSVAIIAKKKRGGING